MPTEARLVRKGSVVERIKEFERPEGSGQSAVVSSRINNFEALDPNTQTRPIRSRTVITPTQLSSIQLKPVQTSEKQKSNVPKPPPPPPPPKLLKKKPPPPPPKKLLQEKRVPSVRITSVKNKLEQKLGVARTDEKSHGSVTSNTSIMSNTWQAITNFYRTEETNVPDNTDELLASKLQWLIDKLLSHDRVKIMGLSEVEDTSKYTKQTWTNVEVKDYCPEIFSSIRNMDGGGIAEAICNNPLKVVCSPGKSGALLMFSQDAERKFVIKSTTQAESLTMRNMIHSYYRHLHDNPNSLLPRFYAHFRFSHEGKFHYALIMNNHFSGVEVNDKFDLKGSSVGRRASPSDQQSRMFKDLDLLDMKISFQLERNARLMLIEQLEMDCKFLAEHSIMDYSLLVGVATNNRRAKCGLPKTRRFVHGNDAIAMGIIDILCVWNFSKRTEMIVRSTYSDYNGLSPIPPKSYAERFVQFMSNQLFTEL